MLQFINGVVLRFMQVSVAQLVRASELTTAHASQLLMI